MSTGLFIIIYPFPLTSPLKSCILYVYNCVFLGVLVLAVHEVHIVKAEKSRIEDYKRIFDDSKLYSHYGENVYDWMGAALANDEVWIAEDRNGEAVGYLIDGEEVVCDQDGTLRFQFKAEIFDDEALDIANNLCKASLKLGENHTVLDIEPLSCEKEIEVLENEFFFIPCDTTEEHYDALSYALMCAVKRD